MPEEWVAVIAEFKAEMECYQSAGIGLDAAIMWFVLKRQDGTFHESRARVGEIKTAIEESGPPGPA